MQTTEAFLAVFETEPWNSGRPASSSSGGAGAWEGAGFFASAIALDTLISTIEASWIASVASGKTAYVESENRNFGEIYRRWLDVCEKTLALPSWAVPEGFPGEGVDELLRTMEEVRCLLQSREIEASMRTIDEVLPIACGNPRPERYGH